MKEFIQTKEDGTKFVYVAAGSHGTLCVREIRKETPTQIKTEHSKFNKETGREIGGSRYYSDLLLTKGEYAARKNYHSDRLIEANARKITELVKEIDALQKRNAELTAGKIE